MFKMYNTDLITNITEEVTEYKRGNWINMIAPSDDERFYSICIRPRGKSQNRL